MPFDELQIALPTMTSHETLLVREWISAYPQRCNAWSEKAHQLMVKVGMDKATNYLSALLCDEVMSELGSTEGLELTLMELAIRRINFFEIAVGLLKAHDTSGHFEPAPEEYAAPDISLHGGELSLLIAEPA